MSLSLDEVRKVAKLARLELPQGELAGVADRLNRILGYIDQLKEVDTTGVEPMAHPLPLANVFRDDEPAPSLTPDEALANAPKRVGNYFGVPAVFESDDPVSH